MSRSILDAVVDELVEHAPELIPIAATAIKGLFEGKPVEQVLSRAERDALAEYSQKRFDEALERGRAKPNTGA